MKLAILSALCFLGNSFAAPTTIVPRDLSVINYNFGRVQAVLNVLDQHLARKPSFDQQQWVSYFQSALTMNTQVVEEFTLGSAEIRRGPSVNDVEAIGLNTPATSAVNALNKIIGNLIATKRQAVTVGAKDAILTSLSQLETAASTFMDAINSKAGFISSSIGGRYKTQVTSAIRKGVDEYRKR